MKRRLFKLALILLLGVVASCLEVLAFEVCINWKIPVNTGRLVWYGRTSEQIPYWSYQRRDRFSYSEVSAFRVSSALLRRPNIPVGIEGLPYWFDEQGGPERNAFAALECAVGWPMRMVRVGSYWYEDGHSFGETPVVFWRDLEWPRFSFHLIWLGFTMNTVFYAGLLWTVLLCLHTLRRVIRHKLGRCVDCGYDLRSGFTTGCPECGWGRETEA